MQKLLRFTIILTNLLLISPNSAHSVNRIITIVDDKIISHIDLENRIKLSILSSGLENNASIRKQLEPQILRAMIDELLKINKAKQFDIIASENDINQAIKEIEHRNHMPEGNLKRILQSNNIPYKILQIQIEADLVWRDYIQARYQSAVQISNTELKRAADTLAAKKDKPQFLIAEIFLDVENPEQDLEVQRRAWEFARKIRAGANFSAIAQQFSQAASAAQSGDIDWVAADQLDPALKSALEKLTVGTITDPIKTQYGYHILLLREKKAAGESLGKETLLSFIETLFLINPPLNDTNVASIMSQARVLANSAKSCSVLTTLAKSNPSIKIREIKKLPLSNLSPQMRQLITPLSEGQATEPLLSEMGVIMFTLCEKEDISPDNLSTEQIRLMLIEEKLNNLAKGELREMRRRAHIEVRDT